jgi:hypothetical protein
MTRGPGLGAVLAVLTVLLAAGAGVSGYARAQFVDERDFAGRAASALDDRDVRQVAAERMVDGLAQRVRPDLVAVRPLLTPAVAALIGTRPFRQAFTAAVAARHARVTRGERGVVLEVGPAGALLLDSVRAISPRAAAALPPSPRPELLRLEPRGFELTAARVIADLARWWWPLVAATLLAACACAACAGGVRNALVLLGVAVGLAGLVVSALVSAFGEVFVSHASAAVGLSEEHERAAFGAIWSALFGDLRWAGLLTALGGGVVATLASGLSPGALVAPAVRWARGLGASPHPAARALRATMLVAVGAGLVLEPDRVGRGLLVLAGVVLVLLGVAHATSWAGQRLVPQGARPARAAPQRPATRLGWPVAAVVAAVLTLMVAGVVLVLPAPRALSVEAVRAPAGGCNGMRALCGRRLDEVVFAATHNSFAAADEPGWYFANQRHGIERQLRDGVRALLIDVHYGVRDSPSGRVRTDLAYEGSSRNKVVRELSPQALRTAERLAGRVGRGDLAGPRHPYLCHTLCELGAEPLDEQLTLVREFLDANPGEVVILFMEPYVSVDQIESGLRAAGLLSRVAELRRDRPLPTLGRLVREDKRVVVFAEEDGGSRPWYAPGFAFVQDTPYAARSAGELSCRRFRGAADSPLFLVNHWIATFPPSLSRNRHIGRAVLRERLRLCRRERGLLPNLVAVDFYENSGVIEIAKELNSARR